MDKPKVELSQEALKCGVMLAGTDASFSFLSGCLFIATAILCLAIGPEGFNKAVQCLLSMVGAGICFIRYGNARDRATRLLVKIK